MAQCVSQRPPTAEQQTEQYIDYSLTEIISQNLEGLYWTVCSLLSCSTSDANTPSIDREGTSDTQDGAGEQQYRVSQSELVQRELRRASAESTGSEKLGISRSPPSSGKAFKRNGQGCDTDYDSTDKYGSLALQSKSRSVEQSQPASLLKPDSVIEQPTIIQRLNSAMESFKAIDDLQEHRQEKNEPALKEGKPNEVDDIDQQKMASTCPSTLCQTQQKEDGIILVALSQVPNKQTILQLAEKLGNERHPASDVLTLKKKRTKGLLEILCLSVRPCLVIQIKVEVGFVRTTLVEGGLCDFLEFARELHSVLWLNNQIKLDGEECIEACLSAQRSRLNSLRMSIEKTTFRSEADLHKVFLRVLSERESTRQLLKSNQSRLGRYVDVAAYQLDRLLFQDSGIFQRYVQHYSSLECSYQQKRRQIAKTWSMERCFEYLEVDPTFRLYDEAKANQSRTGMALPADKIIAINPYQSAVDELQRLNDFADPPSKLRCISRAYQLIQECCLSYYSGEIELDTMDNLLPVLIFVVLYADISDCYANVKLVEHFVEACIDNTGLEARIITNVYVSFCRSQMAMQYILTSWQL